MGYRLLLVLICSLSCRSAVLEDEWQGWKVKHYRVYPSQDEENSRLSIWKENYQKILEHNMANHSFTLSLNQFADMVYSVMCWHVSNELQIIFTFQYYYLS